MNKAENPYLLLTPGPLTTSSFVKSAMMTDWCTWDDDYNIDIVQNIRKQLIALATKTDPENYTSILLQGSGSYLVEAAIGSFISPSDKALIISNGAYGKRIHSICDYYKITNNHLCHSDSEPPHLETIEHILQTDSEITHVIAVHCETTSGILNPIQSICTLAKKYQKTTLIDAMSSFGGIPMDIADLNIDILISSANKCLQGVPGFGFAICKQSLLEAPGYARSLSLDLHDQWNTMNKTGKWRFTSPTHTVRAFLQALKELNEEGGIEARHQRYASNQALLVEGMCEMGFEPLIERSLQSPIITSFKFPSDNFSFHRFYTALKSKGFVIYPGKITDVDCFRIGNIGEIYNTDIERLLSAIKTML